MSKKKDDLDKTSKSPTEDFMGWCSSMTQEEKDAWRADVKTKLDKAAALRCEEERRKRQEPPESATSICMVCGSTVKANYVQKTDTPWNMIPIGPGGSTHYYWHLNGYACTQCGLVYNFLPPEHGAKKV